MKKNLIIVVGPSGVGKSTLLDQALKEFPLLTDTTTYTTRAMREGEKEGVPYHFVSKDKFKKLIEENFFVEWAQVHSNLYGTPFYQLNEAWKKGQTVIMDVDIQGARTFKKHFPQAVSVFILPPSIDVLRQRIAGRDKVPPPDLELRMINAQKEIDQASFCDHQITNSDLPTSYSQLKIIIEKTLKNR